MNQRLFLSQFFLGVMEQTAYYPANGRARRAAAFELNLIKSDPYLEPHAEFFCEIQDRIRGAEQQLTLGKMPLLEFASAHEYFGLHLQGSQWVFREWAPNASSLSLIGTFSSWRKNSRYALRPIGRGVWELQLPSDALQHGDLYRLLVEWPGGAGERIPAYVRKTRQDPETKIFCAEVWEPVEPYRWRTDSFKRSEEPLLIYETHVGMALEEPRIGSYLEFIDQVIPRVVTAGYNTIQIMAIQEHPYYGSFGYQVSSFFAPSSRFGTPDELRQLIDAAHEAGLAVFLDLVHSHAVKNEVEGLSRFDGTLYQYFHEGSRGEHSVWDSRLFDYGKIEVLHFLLSNVRYWIDSFHFDGLRFDGVTSMLYYDHGLGEPFTSYDCYFGGNLDRDALTYLALANRVAHAANPSVVTVAEDVSGFPGLAAPEAEGGIGFDFRLAMGIPDYWTINLKTKKDEEWHVEHMFFELTNRRAEERTISYAECHDQALVGDQTIIFRLLQTLMYDHMRADQRDYLVDRGLALHRMIRLITLSTASHGYLNFMGNEFGHPEWIDFPREGNCWSFEHARRLWSLSEDPDLQYHRLGLFDRHMLKLVREYQVLSRGMPLKLFSHVEDQVVAFERSGLIFVFNFNPNTSFPDFGIPAAPGSYQMIFDSDQEIYGGNGRLRSGQRHYSTQLCQGQADSASMKLYLPTRTACVFSAVE